LNKPVERVLIYRLGSLGDTLVALPSLHLVARAFPAAERRMLTNVPVASKAAAAAAVLGESGLVHGYQSYPVGLRDLRALWRLRAEIRAWRPDVLVYLAAGRGVKNARRDALFFRLCGIRRMVGVPVSEELQKHRWLEDKGVLEAEASRLARCIAELGDAHLEAAASWDLRLTQEEKTRAAQVLEPAAGLPLIAVSVGTKVQSKDWGKENWRALLAQMATAYPGHALALAGAREEHAVSEFAAEGWRQVPGAGPVMNVCGELTPRQSAAMFAHARLFVGHDSGPMHLAASVQTPCVAIFSARNKPAVWFPYGQRHRVVYHQTDCWGCGLETCIAQKKKCLTSITVEEVLAQVREQLETLVPSAGKL